MHENLYDFTAALASTAPVPGGGGAAGLIGALAAALGSMAAGLSAARKNSADSAPLREAAARCEALRCGFLGEIDRDAAVFAPLAAAYKLPKDAPGRAETLRRASLDACAAAEETLLLGRETASLLHGLLGLVSPLLLSDLGCAAAACEAALLCASFNLFVNIRPYPGDAEAERLRRLCLETRAQALPLLAEVKSCVLRQLGGEA